MTPADVDIDAPTAADASAAPAVPVADLPSGEPIPNSVPPPPSAPAASSTPSHSSSSSAPKKGKAPRLPLYLLLSAPSRIDAFIAHLNRCMQTPAGIDAVLQFVCYTSRLSAALLAALARHVLAHTSARELIAVALTLPPRATILFTTATTTAAAASPSVAALAATATATSTKAAAETAAAAAALRLSAALKNLSVLTSEARTITRLWGLLGLYFWTRRLAQETFAPDDKTPERSTPEKLVAWAQLLGCVGFQVLENGAYLSSRGVLGWSPAAQARAGKWSARSWGVFVGLELGRLAVELSRSRELSADQFETSRKAMVRNSAWAPLVVHWSTGATMLGETSIGLLGCVPGFMGMREVWRKNAV